MTMGTDWFRVAWDEDRERAPSAWSELLAIPGIRYYPRALEISRTAWLLPVVLDLCAELNVVSPRHVLKYADTGLWTPKERPLTHQPYVTELLLTQQRVLLADQMGLGKTRSAIQAAETVRRHIHHGLRPVVILGPLRVRKTWFRELMATGAISSAHEFCALTSRDLGHSSWTDGASYYFVHYDVVDAWWSRFTSLRPCVTILDEAQYVKNGRSRRARNAAMVSQIAPFRIAVTGTPIANKPSDLYALLEILCGPYTWGTPIQFRERYCGSFRNDFGYVDTSPTNVEELQTRMRPFYLRRDLEDTTIELPPFTRELAEVAGGEKREQLYRGQLEILTSKQVADLVGTILGGGSVGKDTLRTLNQLRRMTSDVKIVATAELAIDVLQADGAVVVFTWQRSTAVTLQKILDETRDAVTGELSIAQREGLVDRFQAEGGALVATYGALADSVTLHRARAVILHDIDDVPSTMLQAEKRIHRIGQTQGCKSYWMVAPKFLDRITLAALHRKCADTELILSIREMLPELASAVETDSFEARIEQSIKEWHTWDS